MCKKLQLLGTPYQSLALRPHWGMCDPQAPLAASSVNESFCFSLRVCFSNDVCSVPNSWRTRNQRHGFMHGWMIMTKILVMIYLYCLKCIKFGQLILRKILEDVVTRCQILRLKCTKFHFNWGSAQTPLGELTALPQTPSCI